MYTRRQFLTRSLRSSSLLAFGTVVPQFVALTARAAPAGKDTVLVVIEMTGGNDGLNTVIPYADDLYHKARPTLRQTKDTVTRLDGHVGLHPRMQGFRSLWDQGQLAVVQAVGYPNPDRSHFEAMDIWQSADPKRIANTGWLGRATAEIKDLGGGVPVLHIGANRLPLALAGTPGGAVSINDENSFHLELGGNDNKEARRRLLANLSATRPNNQDSDLAAFVRRRQVQTLTAVDNLQALLQDTRGFRSGTSTLNEKLQLIANLIDRGFGTRIFYVNLDGFDTHAEQGRQHGSLLGDLADAIDSFFQSLKRTGHGERVRVMTFSEFGRRVYENSSRGTDHGAASCMFVAGPSVKGGVVGKHASLADLDAGDLKFHIDFRRVYATLLDDWLGCDSSAVLNAKWEHVKELELRT